MELSYSQIWLIVGLIMLLAELVSVSLVFVFFAVGALVTAFLVSVGVLTDPDHQILAFSAISVLSLLVFRRQIRRIFPKKGSGKEYNEYAGETAMVVTDIPEGGEGKIFYRGAEWIARSDEGTAIEAGSKVVIVRTDGIKLVVRE